MAEYSFKPPGQLNITEENVSENFMKWNRAIIEVYDQFQWDDDLHKEDPDQVLFL